MSIAALVGGCDFRGMTKAADEDWPVTLYGVGDAPDDPPASCKFVIKVEVNSGDKEIPERKLKNLARDNNANAVASIRKAGNSEGYLGKQYNFRASIFDCPVRPRPKPAASASAGQTPD